MAILKAGFTRGARGRQSKASWGRRASYLASEHDREKAVLYGRDEEGIKPLSRSEAIEEMGGKHVEYRETIVSPSEAECRALEARTYGKVEDAQRHAAQGLAERLSEGKPYVVAVHQEGDRWHLHVAVKDADRPEMYGPKGNAQRAFEDYWRSGQPKHRIQDWEAHSTAKQLQGEARNVTQDIRKLDRERFESIRHCPSVPEKLATASRFEHKERELISTRHHLEIKAINSRHQARGTTGSCEQKVDIERANISRAGAENRLQRREDKLHQRLEGRVRPELRTAHITDRTLAQGRERLVQSANRSIQAAGRAASIAVRSVTQSVVPNPVRALASVATRGSSDSSSSALSLVRSATAATQALSIALRASDLVRGVAKILSTLTRETER